MGEGLKYGFVTYGFLCRIGSYGGDCGPKANIPLYEKYCKTLIPFVQTGLHSRRIIISLIREPELKAWIGNMDKRVRPKGRYLI